MASDYITREGERILHLLDAHDREIMQDYIRQETGREKHRRELMEQHLAPITVVLGCMALALFLLASTSACEPVPVAKSASVGVTCE